MIDREIEQLRKTALWLKLATVISVVLVLVLLAWRWLEEREAKAASFARQALQERPIGCVGSFIQHETCCTFVDSQGQRISFCFY